MSTLVTNLPTLPLVVADLLKLRRRIGLILTTALLTLIAMVVTYGIIELLHLLNPGRYGPAGGIVNLGHGAFLLASLGAVAAVVVAAIAGAGDLEAGVYRELVVTGRSRLALYLSRVPAGFAFLLPFIAAAYAATAVATVVFAGSRQVPGADLLVTTGLWVLLEITVYYLLAVGVACAIGSRAYAIGIVLAWLLAVEPILASISALGRIRELVPGVALEHFTPAAIETTNQEGRVHTSLGVSLAVLVAWLLIVHAVGAWRDTTREA